jgi:hypothetical protein
MNQKKNEPQRTQRAQRDFSRKARKTFTFSQKLWTSIENFDGNEMNQKRPIIRQGVPLKFRA